MENTEIRFCSKCGNIKHPYQRKDRKWVEYVCKQCAVDYHKKYNENLIIKSIRKEYNKKYRLENIERVTQKNHDYRSKNKEMVLLTNAKKRSCKKGIDFNITIEDIFIPEVCPVLGIPIIRNGRGIIDNAPTLDRIDNTKGYVKGNVMVISYKANRLKNDGSMMEHRLIAEYMERNLPIDNEDYCI